MPPMQSQQPAQPQQPVQQFRPRNIIEAIYYGTLTNNQNLNAISQDLHTLMGEMQTMRQEMATIQTMFNTPEQPNALGGEGAVGADPVSAR